ncbi:MAG: hypothetical protein ACKV22_10965 [Bryobacteraceae bacterium]
MQETFNSLVRLSAAITVFGVQQVETAVGTANPRAVVDRLGEVMNGMAAAVSANLDESKLSAVERISSVGRDVVANTTGMVKMTSGWLTRIVNTAGPGSSGTEGR